MESKRLTLKELLGPEEMPPIGEWVLQAILNEECLSYLVWNAKTKDGLIIDPKLEDQDTYLSYISEHRDVNWLAVIDTHTHADHISFASNLASQLRVPLVMHWLSPSQRIDLRVSRSTTLSAHPLPVRLLVTPGHTPDSIVPIWGPFIFGGDTILFGDTGRDDLPGGNPVAHYESVQEVKKHATPDMIFLPGHDHKGGRASSWKTQLEVNPSLTQSRDDFIREASAFEGFSPKLLKKSLFENFK